MKARPASPSCAAPRAEILCSQIRSPRCVRPCRPLQKVPTCDGRSRCASRPDTACDEFGTPGQHTEGQTPGLDELGRQALTGIAHDKPSDVTLPATQVAGRRPGQLAPGDARPGASGNDSKPTAR